MPKTHCAAPELASLLDGSSAGELIPELARHGLRQLSELELAAFLGADWHERTEERLGHRNGYRPRTLTTQVGDLAPQIPKLRSGSILPSILEPRRRELLGLKLGDSEIETFWAEFIKAIRGRLQGCVWQRCRDHFARNLPQCVPWPQGFCAAVGSPGHGHGCPAQRVRPRNRWGDRVPLG